MYHTVRRALEHKKILTREDRDLAIKVLIKYNHLLAKRTRLLAKSRKELKNIKQNHILDVILLVLVYTLLGYKLGKML